MRPVMQLLRVLLIEYARAIRRDTASLAQNNIATESNNASWLPQTNWSKWRPKWRLKLQYTKSKEDCAAAVLEARVSSLFSTVVRGGRMKCRCPEGTVLRGSSPECTSNGTELLPWELKGKGCMCARKSLVQDCCGTSIPKFLTDPELKHNLGPFALSFGNETTTCCTIESGIKDDMQILTYSSSKLITGYIILTLIDQNVFTLETPVCKLLDWWSCSESDFRSRVTVKHLLTQTDGMGTFGKRRITLGSCFLRTRSGTLMGCAKAAYNRFTHPPGGNFRYSDTSFYVMGAIAMNAIKANNFNDVFRKTIGNRLNMSGKSEYKASELLYALSLGAKDPGASFQTTVQDFALFLKAFLQKKILKNKTLAEEAEKPQTVGLTLSFEGTKTDGVMPWVFEGFPMEYGYGQWVECMTYDNAKCENGYMSAEGYLGTYPWVKRHSQVPYWGILMRDAYFKKPEMHVLMGVEDFLSMPERRSVKGQLVPMVDEAMKDWIAKQS